MPDAPPSHDDALVEPKESWNPLRTPVATFTLLLQVATFVAGGLGARANGADFLSQTNWLVDHGLMVDPGFTTVHTEPWRMLASIFTETMWLQVLINLVMWWS